MHNPFSVNTYGRYMYADANTCWQKRPTFIKNKKKI